jgi:6-phosphogluconate dehydrogenase
MQSKIGVIGLGTMGAALARNIASCGFRVSLWNRSTDKITDLVAQYGQDYGEDAFFAPKSFESFIESLEWPKKIIVMVPAGEPLQAVLKQLAPVLNEEDVIIDGGNSIFRVTEIYQQQLASKKIYLLGAGISGGEKGALTGPSIMPGGDKVAFDEMQPILSAIAAEDFGGKACVSYMGKGGAGHYVKMVHNGIEYAEMQALAEAYDMLKTIYQLKHEEIAEIFANWNEGRLNSYLTEISVEVLRKEEDGKPLLDLILDEAGQKGTGTWTAQEALTLGTPMPSIAGSVFMRASSQNKPARTQLAKLYPRLEQTPKMLVSEFAEHLGKALYASRISNFEQGLALLRTANDKYNYGIDLTEVLRIWQGGCIIRCTILKDMREALRNAIRNSEKVAKESPSLYTTNFAHKAIVDAQKSWRLIVQTATQHSIPLAAISGALNHFEAARSETLPANFIQGLRDHFGSHGYKRLDESPGDPPPKEIPSES